MNRTPAVAGRFYTSDPKTLRSEIEPWVSPIDPTKKVSAVGVLCPHAGYLYSGVIAGNTLAQINIPRQILVIGPNHTGEGAWAAINDSGQWTTPLGNIPIASKMARRLMEIDGHLEVDSQAHAREHSLEVQLPLLQVLRPDIEIVPLCLSHFSLAQCRRLGQSIARLIQELEEAPLILASSDMNHYESQEATMQKDQLALEPLLQLDPEGLYQVVHEEGISMCGIIPTTCMLFAAQALGAKTGHLVQHATSGDVTGDYTAVVGYAGVIIR